MTIHAFASFAHWQASRTSLEAGERAVLEGVACDARSLAGGTCPVCGAGEGFVHPGPAATDWREAVACVACHANARQRAAVLALEDALGPVPGRVYLTEQASWLYVALRKRYRGLVGSEYGFDLHKRAWLTLWLWRQRAFVALRGEDATRLRFRGGRFRGVVSLDVLEHVPVFRAALREFARILAPGGACVLTVPFHHDREANVLRARLEPDGSIRHLLPPEYHGDPVAGGILAFHDFGWELLERMRDAGFVDVAALRVGGVVHGLPQGVWVLRGRVAA